MPELPEVETVLRTLEDRIKGQKILQVKVYWDNIIAYPTVEEFEKEIVGQTFNNFTRRGKFLVFELDDYILISHLRMEGKYYIYQDEQEKSKHDHVIFKLDKCFMHYNDTRKFGKMYLYKKCEPLEAISNLGKEPFDETLTGEYLKQFNKKNNQYVKTTLLDQSMITGIGNIYADEILFACKLNPTRRSMFISIDKWDEIIKATRDILSEAIKAGGTTIRSYTSSLGVTGRFQLNLKVHANEGKMCSNCASIIKKQIYNTRGCNYCENCQKEESIKIAITGSIGSGKSTVREIVEKLGYKAISCDKINHDLLETKSVKKQISNILSCDVNGLTNQYIASRIYSDDVVKKEVEGYLHKTIYEEIIKFYEENKNEKIVFVEVPLLFETDYYKHFDYNILVKTDENKLIERLIKDRNMSKEEINKILSKQLPVSKKQQLADMVIENNSTFVALSKNVEKRISDIIKL